MSEATTNIDAIEEGEKETQDKTNADKNVEDGNEEKNSPEKLQKAEKDEISNEQTDKLNSNENQEKDVKETAPTEEIENDDVSMQNKETKIEQELGEPQKKEENTESDNNLIEKCDSPKLDPENESKEETKTSDEIKVSDTTLEAEHDKKIDEEKPTETNTTAEMEEADDKEIETIKLDDSFSDSESTFEDKSTKIPEGLADDTKDEGGIETEEQPTSELQKTTETVDISEEIAEVSESKDETLEMTATETEKCILTTEAEEEAEESTEKSLELLEVPEDKEKDDVVEKDEKSLEILEMPEDKQKDDVVEKDEESIKKSLEVLEVPEDKQKDVVDDEESSIMPEKETAVPIETEKDDLANSEPIEIPEKNLPGTSKDSETNEKQTELPADSKKLNTSTEKEKTVNDSSADQALVENILPEDLENETDSTTEVSIISLVSEINIENNIPLSVEQDVSKQEENISKVVLEKEANIEKAPEDKSEKSTPEKVTKESFFEEFEEAVEELMQTAKEDKVERKISEGKAAEKTNKTSSTITKSIDEITAIIEIDDDNDDIEETKSKEAIKDNEKDKDEKAIVEKATDENDTKEKDANEKTIVENSTTERVPEDKPEAEKAPNDKATAEKIPDDKPTAEKISSEKIADEKSSDENKITSKDETANETTTTDVIEIDDDDDETKMSKGDEKEQPKKQVDATIENKVVKDSTDKSMEAKTENGTEKIARMHTMPMIFYKKECINFECPKTHKEFHRAPQFALNYFKISKKKMKVQYICGDCYDMTLAFYQEFCGVLDAKQPILMRCIANKKQEFVEILDSSDEDDDGTADVENKEKEYASFSQADLDLIENEFENTMRKVFDRVDIQSQLTWTKTIFTERVKKLQNELEYIDEELNETQKTADRMYHDLYNSGKYRINTLKPLDLDNDTDQVPPVGEIERPGIKVGGTYYAARNKAIACWVSCNIIEQVDSNLFVPHFRVKFLSTQFQQFKNLSAKLIAYYDPPAVRLSVGQRVIAYFDGTTLSSNDKEKNQVKSAFYPGIIAEEMKPNNFYRYLIFYDDGYTQYVSHKDVRLVCHVARNVWDDVDQVSREFIKKYVQEYRVNRPMVQTHKGQKMATEKNGRWVPARVIDIDCSLVRMQFEGPKGNHTEWIYRGSLRLNPVYMEYQKSKSNQASRAPVSRVPRRTEPFIRYTEDEEQLNAQQQQQQQQQEQQQQDDPSRALNRSNSASSSTSQPTVRHLNANTIYLEDENKPKGKVIYYTAKRQMPTRVYRPHDCGSHCLIKIPHNLNGYSPLAKPLLSGWERLFSRQKIKKTVYYRAPCGKMFRNMKELHSYLRLTKCPLNVDNFDFNAETSCLAEFEAENVMLKKRDISEGQEKIPLPLINYYDETLPECIYSAKVIPTEGVDINKDLEYLICCDCDDDCVDKSKCACWQLTVEGVKTTNPDAQTDDIGYQYKRLYDHLPTGIYECNPRCKCKSNCLNRVVQHGLGTKLQVFKTSNRGWGLRCLNDIPQGSFVCVYAGNLLTEAKANEGGQDAGDEYFAELDYIETVEQLKEGYESDVENPDEDDEENYEPEAVDDADFRPSRSTERRVKRGTGGARGEGERQTINFNPNMTMENETKKKRVSVRTLFGKDEAVYVMDAKVTGNLGRYFNHSCSPNLFVQNVFVDTHDLRFPWVAFFASTHIRAGTELTWNYNYEVGVVPGKVLYCQCGSANCRQRLL